MMFLKLLLNATVMLVVAATSNDCKHCTIVSPYDNIPLDEVAPVLYNIDFNVKYHLTIFGESNIFLNVYHTTRRIILHACDLNIDVDSITFTSTTLMSPVWNVKYKHFKYVYYRVTQIMELTFENDIDPGKYILNIKFELPVVDTNYLILHDETFWLSIMGLELNSARRVFPCWDNLGTKARFKISVIYSANYTVLSNMPISHITNENSMNTIYFTKTPMIAPREVAIVIMQYVISKTSRVSFGVTIWYRPQVKDYIELLLFMIEDCKTTYETYIGEYKLILKSDHVLIPNITKKIMGYPGLILYREQDFTYDVNSDYPGHMSSMMNLLGLEMARRWFGGITNPSSWFDFLFSETFALFLNHILAEKLQDKSIQDLYAVQMLQSAFYEDLTFNMKLDSYRIDNADKIEKELCFPIYCNKGAVLIRMLYYLFTADDFRTAIRIYLTKNDYASFKLNDLWDVLQRVLDEGNKRWIYRVQEIMNTWLTLDFYPEVYVNRDYNSNTVNISTQDNFHSCIIPITYITQSNLISGYTWDITWLHGFENKIISGIAKDDFIIVNLEQAGYYRVNYDFKSWQNIVSYLIYQNYTHIHVINRAQLIDDAFYFAMQEKLDPFIFSSLIFYLSQETSYIVWYPMFNIMLRMSTYLQLPQSKNIKIIILQSLKNLLEKITYEEQYNEDYMTKSLRLLTVRWACKLGLEECKKAALFQLLRHLDQPDIPILPWWREWIYCTGMEMANLRIWQRWMKKCIKEQDKLCLTYLACTGNKDILVNYVEMLLGTREMDKFMEKAGTLMLFHTLFRKQAENDFMLEIFVNNQDRINDKIYNGHDMDPVKILRKVIGTVYSKDSLYMMMKYAEELKFKDEIQKGLFLNIISLRHREIFMEAKSFEIFTKGKSEEFHDRPNESITR